MIEHLGGSVYARFNGQEIVLSKSFDGIKVTDSIALTALQFAQLLMFYRTVQSTAPTKYLVTFNLDEQHDG